VGDRKPRRLIDQKSLRLLLESLPDGVLLIDRSGMVSFANPAAESLFNFEPGTLAGGFLGFPVVEGVTEIEIPRTGGRLITAEIRAVRVRWQEQELYLASLRDVSERKRAEQKMLTLGQQLFSVYETIQGRLGKELHDTIGQPLIGLKLALHRFRERQEQEPDTALEEIGALIDGIINSIRDFSHTLRPAVSNDWSLSDALENHFHRLRAQRGLAVHFRDRAPEFPLPPITETVVLRIVQEGLDNVLRHAKVDEVEVLIDTRGDDLVLMIEDRGRGFDPARKNHEGIGLEAMRERAELAGGTMTVDSSPGKGTRLTAVLPLK
jgi:signal transduction histidine kinase